MPVQVIPKFTLSRNHGNAMFVKQPQQPSQPLPMYGQAGQARHNHDIHKACAHRPNQGKQTRTPKAVSATHILTSANHFQPLLLCSLQCIQLLFCQPLAIS